MALVNRCQLTLLIFAILTSKSFGEPTAPADKSFAMAMGQTEIATFPADAEVRVTRRGIVDVHHGSDDHWQLTGLRAGFVIVEAVDPETGASIPPRYHVTVRPVSRAHPAKSRIAWICDAEGIRCTPTGEIIGTTADWDWYVRAYSVCTDSSTCFFRVRLKAAGQSAADASIRGLLGPEYATRLLPDGRLVVAGPCEEDGKPRRVSDVIHRLGAAASSGLLSLGCHADRDHLAYRLSARLFLAEAGTAKRLGFTPNPVLSVASSSIPPGGPNVAGYSASLAALERERDVQIVGEPLTRLLPDRPVEIVSGGEFQVVEPDKDGDGLRAAWKQHGLTLKVRATPLGDDGARLQVDGSLKSRSDGQHSLTVSSIATHLDVRLGTPTLAAVLGLATTDDSNTLVPYLGRLPLIGPLFRLNGRDHSSTRLIVWLELTKDDPTQPLRRE